ncbi:MAG: tRNA (adenosine(37)-N6)-dimethylallyltransferase MiaA [Chlorobi bacterium]|nr:tRNA (adenosine(37)-N6)-dimethylallyltransferase MiaA [Chlorobiota bacterium]MCI0715613.1 tRNA (adenosine(37)-N6)-dimethylallyltransferase MiaA [Chlorobiota bacterium]
MTKPKVLTIVGPTASGKTEISIRAAEEIKLKSCKDVEIISADSRQVYKYIPIASAQPSKEQLKKFKHHFIASLELDEEFNAGEFGKKGRALVARIFENGKIPIIVGGSGLYISSLIYGLFDYDEPYSEHELKQKQKIIRKKLYDELENKGLAKLFSELKKADPQTADNMTHITERRVMRALEVYYATGLPVSFHRRKKVDIGFEAVQIGIDLNRGELYKRINNRVDSMIEKGLIGEVKKLKTKGFHYTKYNSLNTVGIKEVFDYLDGLISYERMAELIKQNTRRFAKRQLTWFRRYKDIKWVSYDSIDLDTNTIIEGVMK